MLPLFRPAMPLFQQNQPGSPPAAEAPPVGEPAQPPPPPAPSVAPVSTTAPAEPTRDYDKEIKDLRAEAASWRTKFQSASKTGEETLRQLATQLGIEIPGGAPDPKALADELAKTRRENLELKVGNALEQASRKHGADSDLLIPYLRGSAALDKLDPAAESFSKDISEMVKGLLEKNPKLKAGVVASRSAMPPDGIPPQAPQLTREQVKAMSAAGQHEQIEEARKKGQLDSILRGGA